MKRDDDTVRTGRQAAEDVGVARLEAGQIPGWHQLDASQLASAGAADLVVVRIPKDVAQAGTPGGEAFAQFLLGALAPVHRGRAVMSFDGWADDPRPLGAVPEVVAFCRGVLWGGPQGDPWEVLRLLADERLLCGAPGLPDWLDLAGQLWLVAHAYPDDVIVHTPQGWARDIGLNIARHSLLLNGVEP